MLTAEDLHGTFVALLTPVDDDGGPDLTALQRLVQHTVAGGVAGVCPVGSTGEGPRLTRQQRVQVTRTVRSHAHDLPVIAAPAALSIADVIEEIPQLAAAGADAVLVAPPSYYPVAPGEVADFYTTVADASPVPVLVYNIPVMTKVTVPPSVVADLATHPKVAGIKDSSRDLEYLRTVVRATEGADFAVLTGTDAMLTSSLALGATGAITSSGNLVPALGREIYDAYSAGDLARADQAQRRLFDIVQACRTGPFPAGWKYAIALAGFGEPTMVPPARALDDAHRTELATRLHDLGVLPTASLGGRR